MKRKLPNDLYQRIQHAYTDKKYKEGIFVFTSLGTETVEIIIAELINWATDKKIDTIDSLKSMLTD